jgi:hypothetical protein
LPLEKRKVLLREQARQRVCRRTQIQEPALFGFGFPFGRVVVTVEYYAFMIFNNSFDERG